MIFIHGATSKSNLVLGDWTSEVYQISSDLNLQNVLLIVLLYMMYTISCHNHLNSNKFSKNIVVFTFLGSKTFLQSLNALHSSRCNK